MEKLESQSASSGIYGLGRINDLMSDYYQKKKREREMLNFQQSPNSLIGRKKIKTKSHNNEKFLTGHFNKLQKGGQCSDF